MKKVFNVIEAILAVVGIGTVISNTIVAIKCSKGGESYYDRMVKVGELGFTGKFEDF